ncbi:uncharacterized protein LOC114521648 [Dendronephthya gigantea]|uniref:uncharacterized protein LOC114521648 n=1 Tax=Dendronephthya gigantea TaxID=151771 RepID=UPI00106A196A|nr:uncharacterized protein LOC114521648 [Dendronephthya gigantea]
MQKANSILRMEKTMCRKRKQNYYKFVRENCSPQVVPMALKRSSQRQSEKGNAMNRLVNEVKTMKINLVQGKCQLPAQVDGPTKATISELLRLNKENTIKINKILGILAAQKQMDSKLNYPQEEAAIDGEERDGRKPEQRQIRKVFQSSNCSLSSIQNINKRRRFSSLGEINRGFEDIQLSELDASGRNDTIGDLIRRRRSTLRRSSSVASIQAFKFLAPGRSSGFLSQRVNQRGSVGSITL